MGSLSPLENIFLFDPPLELVKESTLLNVFYLPDPVLWNELCFYSIFDAGVLEIDDGLFRWAVLLKLPFLYIEFIGVIGIGLIVLLLVWPWLLRLYVWLGFDWTSMFFIFVKKLSVTFFPKVLVYISSSTFVILEKSKPWETWGSSLLFG